MDYQFESSRASKLSPFLLRTEPPPFQSSYIHCFIHFLMKPRGVALFLNLPNDQLETYPGRHVHTGQSRRGITPMTVGEIAACRSILLEK